MSRVGCSIDCKLSANHPGNCICQNSRKTHICNKACSLKNISREESCFDNCSLNADHEGDCICSSKRHICSEDCDYKNNSRTGCYGRCSKNAGHNGDHLCDNKIKNHKCGKKCYLSDKSRSGCNNYCDKNTGHEGKCLCNSTLDHLCKEFCHLNGICHNYNNPEFCNQKSDHEGKHDCLKEHLCDKHCELENISRNCEKKCILPYNHKILDKTNKTNCICRIKDGHLCREKCELCKFDRDCEFNSGHEGHHLCSNEHDCQSDCEDDGICEIITIRNLRIRKSHRLQMNGNIIEFDEISEQKSRRLKCNIKIPPSKFEHNGNHKCDILAHKCGYQCKLCDRMCSLEKGHKGFHDCDHGHINNAVIFADGNSAKIHYLNNEYDFQNEESANIFTCYQYCKEQGRGHIHIIESDKLNQIENINIQLSKNNQLIKMINNNLYGCKCQFFWEQILKFNFKDKFEDKDSFNKCPAKCSLCQENDKKTYCEEQLWHEPINSDFIIYDEFWISKEGHKFICHHPAACHTIFIVDKSGSMEYGDIKPNLEIIKQNKNFNNRFGKLIEEMDNYIKRRKNINPEDVFTLISFSDTAEIIFDNINCCPKNPYFNFIEECIQKISCCKGETLFELGFIKGEKILGNIDRNRYKPVIILFSDGADQKPDETIKIVKRVRINFNIIIFLLI